MHWKNLANYDYLGAYSLEGITNEITLTIKDLKLEEVTSQGGKKDRCIIAYFEEKEANGVVVKPMVMNKTNCKTIEKVYGTGNVEDWIGKLITIYSTETKLARDIVPCLRVKEEVPEKPQHICVVCGSIIEDDKVYTYSTKKYGVGLCSKDCLEKYEKSLNKEQEGEN